MAGQPPFALPLEEVVVKWHPPGLPWRVLVVGDLPSCLSSGGMVVPQCHPCMSLEAVGEEHSHHLVVTQKSLTSWGGRGYPHLRTAVEGLEEGDLQC